MSQAIVFGFLLISLVALLGAAIWILLSRVRAWVGLWNEVLGPLGGRAEPYVRLRSVLRARVALGPQIMLEMEQWKGGGAISHGQIVARLSSPRFRVPPFFFGADGWAAAFCRWGLRLSPFATGLSAPLDHGRAELPSAVGRLCTPAVASGLSVLGVHFAFGRGDAITLYVPGSVESPAQKARLEAVLAVARALTEALSNDEG